MTATLDIAQPRILRADTQEEIMSEIASETMSRKTVGNPFVEQPRMTCRTVSVYYSAARAINNVSIDVACNEVLAMIGPSGCGKSTFIRCLNRMNDTVPGCRVEGGNLSGRGGYLSSEC